MYEQILKTWKFINIINLELITLLPLISRCLISYSIPYERHFTKPLFTLMLRLCALKALFDWPRKARGMPSVAQEHEVLCCLQSVHTCHSFPNKYHLIGSVFYVVIPVNNVTKDPPHGSLEIIGLLYSDPQVAHFMKQNRQNFYSIEFNSINMRTIHMWVQNSRTILQL